MTEQRTGYFLSMLLGQHAVVPASQLSINKRQAVVKAGRLSVNQEQTIRPHWICGSGRVETQGQQHVVPCPSGHAVIPVYQLSLKKGQTVVPVDMLCHCFPSPEQGTSRGNWNNSHSFLW